MALSGSALTAAFKSVWETATSLVMNADFEAGFSRLLTAIVDYLVDNPFAGSDPGIVPTSVGGTSNFLRADGSWAAPGGSTAIRGVYGDGSDGALTITTGNTHTLTYNEFRTDVTVESGATLDCDGWIMTCSGTLTVESGGVVHGGIANAGNDGNVLSGTGGAAASTSGRFLGVNGAGGTGGIANGQSVSMANAIRNPASTPDAGKGGAGGLGPGGAGGAGGTRSVTESFGSGPRQQPLTAMGLFVGGNNDTDKVYGGSGGGGGGGHATTAASGSGGGGGAGGLPVVLVANNISNSGAIRSLGANGGNGTGTNGGGGGGGGGGTMMITTESYTGTAPDVSGGTGGSATGTGVAGSNGETGIVIINPA